MSQTHLPITVPTGEYSCLRTITLSQFNGCRSQGNDQTALKYFLVFLFKESKVVNEVWDAPVRQDSKFVWWRGEPFTHERTLGLSTALLPLACKTLIKADDRTLLPTSITSDRLLSPLSLISIHPFALEFFLRLTRRMLYAVQIRCDSY